ncbi:MAG: branched-chain alpha-keto acid dehydrogenase subunit E2 [Gammaproteobacteria bacterium RIFCSPHIGHO2_12_FULL_41_20]|nr:MAG: branched-chain alpha-keto acid dehydrogenase subunit E2 [Gammaproteobacteria bacterium RIFCSPHIGHO2_12_FULL_41_20]
MSAIKNVTVPDLGGATDVDVVEVLVKPGQHIQANASVVTLESDKTTMDVPATVSGTVKEVKVKVGDKVSSGTVILVLETQGETLDTVPSPVKPQSFSAQPKQAAAVVHAASEAATGAHAGPGVRRMAHQLGVDLAQIAGSGPKQRILKEDVQAYIEEQQPTAALPDVDFTPFGPVETKPLSRVKRISGKNLQRNWNWIPHVTQFGEADITELESFRQTQKTALEKQGIKLTPLVFIMRAVAAALKQFPEFNSSLDGSGENLLLKHYIHLGVAVDTHEGLVVPVIRDVDKKGMVELAKELGILSEKARNKQLLPGEMQGGCFSISSLGGIGGTAFTPIVNHPEVAILGVSKASYKPVYQAGSFVPRLLLPLSLSYDHRVIDGAEGARFMVRLTELLADIRNLLL